MAKPRLAPAAAARLSHRHSRRGLRLRRSRARRSRALSDVARARYDHGRARRPPLTEASRGGAVTGALQRRRRGKQMMGFATRAAAFSTADGNEADSGVVSKVRCCSSPSSAHAHLVKVPDARTGMSPHRGTGSFDLACIYGRVSVSLTNRIAGKSQLTDSTGLS